MVSLTLYETSARKSDPHQGDYQASSVFDVGDGDHKSLLIQLYEAMMLRTMRHHSVKVWRETVQSMSCLFYLNTTCTS